MPEIQHKPRFWKWTKRIFGALLLLIVLIALAGLVYQAIFDYRAKRDYPPPGKRVDIGGYRLHINCIGEGSPTVLIESGGGGPHLDFALVQPEVARFTRVCGYDRAGLGWSEPSPLPRDGEHIASELASLLKSADIPGPYVLVGQSLGGIFARIFAAHHRAEIAGVVLVDSSHEDQHNRFPPALMELWRRQLLLFKIAPVLARFGALPLLGYCKFAPDADPRLKTIEGMWAAQVCRSETVPAAVAEILAMETSFAQVRTAGSLGSIPLTVLSADPATHVRGLPADLAHLGPQFASVATELQVDLTRLSTNSSRIVASGCGHGVQVECPQIVINAIRTMVEAVR